MPAKKDSETPGTAVAKMPAFTLRSPEAVRAFLLPDRIEPTDAREASIAIIDQVLSATTVDEILAESNVVSWQKATEDDPEHVFEMTGGIRILPSDPKYINDRTLFPGFIVAQAIDVKTGEEIIVSTGAYKVVAQLQRLWEIQQLAGLRLRAKFRQTKQGFQAMSLVGVPAADATVTAD